MQRNMHTGVLFNWSVEREDVHVVMVDYKGSEHIMAWHF